jgi:hypothetical protein
VPAFYPVGSNVHFSYRLLLLCGEQTIHFPELNSTESLTWRTKLTANWLKTYFIALRRTHFLHSLCVVSIIRKGLYEILFHILGLHVGGFSNIFNVNAFSPRYTLGLFGISKRH